MLEVFFLIPSSLRTANGEWRIADGKYGEAVNGEGVFGKDWYTEGGGEGEEGRG